MNQEIALSRVKQMFQDRPWTHGLLLSNLVCWLCLFFGFALPTQILSGELSVETAWRWLSYPLASDLHFLWLACTLFVFWWVAKSLEGTWGSHKFGRVFLTVTLLAASFQWLSVAVLTSNPNPSVSLRGLSLPLSTLFVIWAGLNPRATVLLMLVIPVQARYLALAAVLLLYFGSGPWAGLFAIALPVLGWLWVTRWDNPQPIASNPGRSLSSWWKDQQKSKAKSRFQVHQGGQADLPRSPLSEPRSEHLSKLNPRPGTSLPNDTELDRILDKIRFEGMASLTDEERATLDRQSRKLREET